jgi:hypothetical protein
VAVLDEALHPGLAIGAEGQEAGSQPLHQLPSSVHAADDLGLALYRSCLEGQREGEVERRSRREQLLALDQDAGAREVDRFIEEAVAAVARLDVGNQARLQPCAGGDIDQVIDGSP